MPETLDKLNEDWVQLYEELNRQHPACVAIPHLSVTPPGYDPLKFSSILLIGKATRGQWDIEEGVSFDINREINLDSSQKSAKNFLETWIFSKKYNSAFWNFAHQLSEAIARASQVTLSSPLQNLIWTNLCKIGVDEGNPERKFYDCQRDLAIKTLKAEIQKYCPKILVFVTGNYGEDIIGDVVEDQEQRSWNRSLEENGFWSRDAMGSIPAALWTYHPQGKTKDTTRRWIAEACRLIA